MLKQVYLAEETDLMKRTGLANETHRYCHLLEALFPPHGRLSSVVSERQML